MDAISFKIAEQELSAPKKRNLNDCLNDDFVAIDFETMTSKYSSACAIGMVRVIDGVIFQRFYSLINPIRDSKTLEEPNYRIHGISLAEAEKAPDFAELFPIVKSFIGSLKIVCHNSSTDINIFNSLMAYFGLSGLDTSNNICTYKLTGKSLYDCCAEYGIKMQSHHDALSDAEACARVYLQCIGKPYINQAIGTMSEIYAAIRHKAIEQKYKVKLNDDNIRNKNTPFYDSTVVITGTFDAYPSRNELAKKIQSLGAKISGSISKRTNIVVIGDGAGPKKIEKITELRAAGIDIRIMLEEELKNIVQ